MSVPSLAPAASIRARAVLVLLVTLLAHALVLEEVRRTLAGTATAPSGEIATVTARLLPLPPPRAAAPPAPAPRAAAVPGPPRPRRPLAPAAPVAAPAPIAATAPAGVPAVVDVGPDAFGAERPAAPAQAEQAGAESSVPATPTGAEVSAAPSAAVEPEPFEATGASLSAALAALAERRAALPASARYVYRTTNSELRLATGTTTVDWELADDGRYRLRLSTEAIGVTILELESQGALRAFGLAPDRYTEKRVRRGTMAANFDWDGRRVTFSARSHERPLADGVQDRVSFQFQLMLLGQAQPERFRTGAQTVLWMAGRDDVASYRFRSAGPEPTRTGVGQLDAVRVERIVEKDTDARIEVWLVPALGWLPARLRFTDRYGRVTESVLESAPAS